VYDTYVGFEFEIERKIKTLISKLELTDITNFKYPFICAYHSTRALTRRGIWRIEKDCSLSCGAEFISPPQKLEQSIETMKTFLDVVKKHGSGTSNRCGCHINMSLTKRGKILKINEDELLANINWRLMSFLWGNRLVKLNVFCRNMNSMFAQIKHHSNGIYGSISEKAGIGSELFSKRHACIVKKTSLVNSGNYYELRFPGGQDYHKYPDKIEQTVRHFSEILEKSREAVCNNKTNRKIISYINRLHATNFAWSELLKRKTNLIPIIKTFANTYQEQIGYQTGQDRVIKVLMSSITNVITNRFVNYDDKQRKKLKAVVCKNCLFYYFLKYAFFNYCRNKKYTSFNPLYNFNLAEIDLTVPKEESDFDKLWLSSVYCTMKKKEQIHIIKSIKSNKAKVIFEKMTKSTTYRTKIIGAQIRKKRQLSLEK
jgi:hypothetical protein